MLSLVALVGAVIAGLALAAIGSPGLATAVGASLLMGSMVAVATSIAADMGLDAPRSIPAGWATAGLGIGGGAALLIAGIVRRTRYGKWRDKISGPMVAPTRAGATVGLSGQF